MHPRPADNVLCPLPAHASSGYAWRYIEGLCGAVADAAAERGRTTYVAYASAPAAPPAALAGTAARLAVVDFGRRDAAGLAEQRRFLLAHGVRTLYLSDVETFDPWYALWRAAGVRRIVTHAHGSSPIVRPRGWRRALKRARARLAWMRADAVIAVSDFVAERERAGALTPPRAVHRVWNAVTLPDAARLPAERARVRAELDIAPEATVIAMTARASHDKGVVPLLRAADRVIRAAHERDVHLVFAGGGPHFAEIAAAADALPSRARLHLVGPQPSSSPFLAAADLAAAPSVYPEALGLAVLEAMAHERPVVATTVGGIPEVVRDGREGLLVPPGDEDALAGALGRLVADPELRARLGRARRPRAAAHFGYASMRAALVDIVLGPA